jgi:RNase P/RNase MRP subunit POP5
MTRRYFLVEVVSGRALSGEEFGRALAEVVQKYFGLFGLSRIDPRLIRFDAAQSLAIVGCTKEGAQDLQAAMALMSDVSDSPVAPITLRVSGTIKGLRSKKSR